MKKKFPSIVCICLSFLIFVLPLSAEINLLSPVKGEWANRQMLVIDNSDGGDFLYSVDGADPETFGFAMMDLFCLMLRETFSLM